LVILKENKTQ